MAVRWESTSVEGKTMRLHVGVPERPGPPPGVVVAQHAGGVDAQMQDVVHRLHREGYVVARPNSFTARLPMSIPRSARACCATTKPTLT